MTKLASIDLTFSQHCSMLEFVIFVLDKTATLTQATKCLDEFLGPETNKVKIFQGLETDIPIGSIFYRNPPNVRTS